MPGLGASFGRGAATNYQQDMANSDCILFMGSNMAEAHPVAYQWVVEAKSRGATVIHVDPHYSRTSVLADLPFGRFARMIIETEGPYVSILSIECIRLCSLKHL